MSFADDVLVPDAIERAAKFQSELATMLTAYRADPDANPGAVEMLSRAYALTGNLAMHLGDYHHTLTRLDLLYRQR